MGIPSYYKTLCDRIPGLLVKKLPEKPTHFWVDFNCMVYHCIRRPGVPIYPGEEGRIQWENIIIKEVCKYLKELVDIVGPTEMVYVGVDGVVPMAKIRQQRLRRFKSVWTAAEEERIGIRPFGEPRWDTNSITPGTAFMERLGVALHKIPYGAVKWNVSAADEPGEGEHKLMRMMRSIVGGSHVVYGLDADLILLSILQNKNIWLFREAEVKGRPAADAIKKICGDLGGEEYTYFSIKGLREYIGGDDSYIFDYCMGMSLLGNDFLPHSMSVKLKEGGHEILLSMLKEVRAVYGTLCDGGSWKKDSLKACFSWLAVSEAGLIQESVLDKIGKRYQRTRGTNEKEHALDEWNKTPLRACDELALISGSKLKADWRSVYYQRYLGVNTQEELDSICESYIYGLEWICRYYVGGNVDQKWYFHSYLPPLWSDLAAWMGAGELFTGTMSNLEPIKPQEQLSLVLPLQSYWLVRDKSLRKLPIENPQYWPSRFELFTAGHKQMWECEAIIPILGIGATNYTK
jgi:5'-3' exonuclease